MVLEMKQQLTEVAFWGRADDSEASDGMLSSVLPGSCSSVL